MIKRLIMGCDEAGRGPVIGPMVLAGLAFDERALKEVTSIGVRDSKMLTPKGRERLYRKIKDLAEESCVVKLQPRLIDSYVIEKGRRSKNLNSLEAEVIAKMIKKVRPRITYVDCPDPNTERFTKTIRDAAGFRTKVVCEHKADYRRPVVAASSIVAKVVRDREIAKLRSVWGDFGSGYPSDPKTRRFLQEVIVRGNRPEIVRWSWSTLRKISRQLSDQT
ncbi:MAG: ribonuclease HII [Candidatus Bathyarchaeia archaeon]